MKVFPIVVECSLSVVFHTILSLKIVNIASIFLESYFLSRVIVGHLVCLEFKALVDYQYV